MNATKAVSLGSDFFRRGYTICTGLWAGTRPQNAHQLLVRQRGGHQKVRLHQDPAANRRPAAVHVAIVAAKHRLLGPGTPLCQPA